MDVKLYNLEYDIHVGKGYDPNRPYEDNIKQMAKRLTQKRIDVIGQTDAEFWLIEVCPTAGSRTLGQLLTYEFLLTQERFIDKPIRRVIVCERTALDMYEVFMEYDITVYIV